LVAAKADKVTKDATVVDAIAAENAKIAAKIAEKVALDQALIDKTTAITQKTAADNLVITTSQLALAAVG